MQTFGGGECFAVFHICTPVEVIHLHQVHCRHLLFFVGGNEACPRAGQAVQHLYGVAPHVRLVLGHEALVVAHAGEALVVRRHGAAVGRHPRLVGQILCIVFRSRYVKQQRIARTQK